MKKIIPLFVLVFVVAGLCIAQQLPLSNQYVVNKFSLSPAYAGAGDNFEVYGTYRRDWMGISGAPETKYISANGIIHKNMGLGASVSSMQAGIFTNLSANLSYAYHARIAGANYIGFGIAAGMVENHLDLSGKAAQADPVVLANTNKTSSAFDASFGILFHNNKLRLGVSMPRMLASNDDEKKKYFLATQLQAHIGYKLSINKMWALDPVAIVSQAKNAPLFYEIAVPIIYQQKIWLTPMYKKSSIAIGLGVALCGNFIMNYSYEFSTSGIAGQSSGTHEITIGWRFVKKKTDQPASDSKKPYYDWINK